MGVLWNIGGATAAGKAAAKAGFRGEGLRTIIAIGGAESGYNRMSHNAVPPDDSYGVWQVNMIGALGPARRKALRLSKDSDLFDVQRNANAAWEISGRGKSFQPWTTFTSGAYKKHLAEADTVMVNSGIDPNEDAPIQPPNPGDITSGITGSIASAANAFTSQFQKIAGMGIAITLAVVFIILGVILINGKGAVKTALKVAKP